jgi:hypothetical protein
VGSKPGSAGLFGTIPGFALLAPAPGDIVLVEATVFFLTLALFVHGEESSEHGEMTQAIKWGG